MRRVENVDFGPCVEWKTSILDPETAPWPNPKQFLEASSVSSFRWRDLRRRNAKALSGDASLRLAANGGSHAILADERKG
jgi:hypothetical protein